MRDRTGWGKPASVSLKTVVSWMETKSNVTLREFSWENEERGEIKVVQKKRKNRKNNLSQEIVFIESRWNMSTSSIESLFRESQ